MGNKVYTIEKYHDYGYPQPAIGTIFASGDLDTTKKEFNKLKEFCIERKDSEDSYYFTLLEWDGKICKELDECKNYD